MDGVRVFHTVQATWNLLERAAGPALDEAHEAGYGVIIKEALANGRLTNWGRPGLRRAWNDRKGARNAGRCRCHRSGARESVVDVVLSGAIGADQLASNLDALSIQLSEAETEQLRSSRSRPRLTGRGGRPSVELSSKKPSQR